MDIVRCQPVGRPVDELLLLINIEQDLGRLVIELTHLIKGSTGLKKREQRIGLGFGFEHLRRQSALHDACVMFRRVASGQTKQYERPKKQKNTPFTHIFSFPLAKIRFFLYLCK